MSDDYKAPANSEQAVMDIHEWLFKPERGLPSRRDELEMVLRLMRNGKTSFRVLVWVGGVLMAVLVFYDKVISFFAQIWGVS